MPPARSRLGPAPASVRDRPQARTTPRPPSTSTAIGAWFCGEAASPDGFPGRAGASNSASVVSVLPPFWSLIPNFLAKFLGHALVSGGHYSRRARRGNRQLGRSAPQALAIASAMATVRRAMSAWSRSTILPSTCSAPLEEFSGRSKTSMILRAKTTSASAGRENLVADRDLIGMDQRLAVHAEIAALFAFGAEAGLVGEIVIDAVDDFSAIGARGGDADRQIGQHRRAARASGGRGFPWRCRWCP